MFSKIVSSVSSAFDFNLATLSGCIDIIVVPKENGELQSTPFHVRFGKAKLLRSREKIVDVTVNWEPTGLKMTLGSAGEAYFIVRDDRTDAEIEADRARRISLLTGDEDDIDSEHFFGAELSSVHQWSPDDEEAAATLEVVQTVETEDSSPAVPTIMPESVQQRVLDPSISERDVHRQFEMIADRRAPTEIEISLCGHLLYGLPSESAHDTDVFQANLLDWDKLNEEPHLWFHPSIVFRFGGEPPYFPSKTALPLLSSWAIFGRSLSKEAFVTLLKGQLKFKDSRDPIAQIQLQAQDLLNPAKPPHSVANLHRRHRSLSPRGTRFELGTPTPSHLPKFMSGFNCCAPHEEETATTFGRVDRASAAEPVLAETLHQLANEEENVLPVDKSTLLREASQRHVSDSPGLLAVTTDRQSSTRRLRRFRKSLKPSSDQLKDLKLRPGPNAITFSVSSPLQGTKTVTGTIYLWPRNAKIVVSDVDGTITRSDLWGQLMPIVGRDWSHPGVAELFSNIRRSDYKILYLTARAIGQADSTRDYLFGLTQNQRNKLPDGPLILSPDRLFPSFKREVIDRKPYVFKIAALRDIRNLFPAFYNPFYSGFGNRDTDHRAYVHVGIPEARIFIIDPTGHVHHVNKTYAKTYESMSSMAAEMFPPLDSSKHEEHPLDEQFNAFNFWSLPITHYPEFSPPEKPQEDTAPLLPSLDLEAVYNLPLESDLELLTAREFAHDFTGPQTPQATNASHSPWMVRRRLHSESSIYSGGGRARSLLTDWRDKSHHFTSCGSLSEDPPSAARPARPVVELPPALRGRAQSLPDFPMSPSRPSSLGSNPEETSSPSTNREGASSVTEQSPSAIYRFLPEEHELRLGEPETCANRDEDGVEEMYSQEDGAEEEKGNDIPCHEDVCQDTEGGPLLGEGPTKEERSGEAIHATNDNQSPEKSFEK